VPIAALLYSQSVGIFVLATAAKAWEPLSVALSQQESHDRSSYPFAALLVVCELLKLAVTLPLLLVLPSESDASCPAAVRVRLAALVARETVAAFALPAAFLALVNHALGYAVPRLDPMTYQVVFKATSVVAVAVLSRLLIPHRTLDGLRWGALALLLAGAALCGDESSLSKTADSREWLRGLLAALCGALSFAVQAVMFDGAAERVPGGPLLHTTAVSLYGLTVNALLLAMLQPSWVRLAAASAYESGQPARLLLSGMRASDALTALSIGAADLTMALFFSLLGANAYSFSRVLALVLSSGLAERALGLALSRRFVLGASVVAVSGWVYHEHERVGRMSVACAETCRRRCGARGYAPVGQSDERRPLV